MRLPLANLADVSSGLTLRGSDAAKATADGNYHLLRIGDLREDGCIDMDASSKIKIDPSTGDKNRLREGDVLVASKGSRATAAVFEAPLPTVAGGQFFVVKLKTDRVLPAYLRWYLNLPETQARLMETSRGSFVQAIPIAAMREFEIELPPLETQHQIVTLDELHNHEQRLLKQIAEKRSQLILAQIAALAAGKIRPNTAG
jgi:restriction endonuclease S subunit